MYIYLYIKKICFIKKITLSRKFATNVFQPFQFLFFHVKSINHRKGYVNSWDSKHHLHENILHHFHHFSFLENLH